MVSLYSPPYPGLLEQSCYTLWSCTHSGDVGLKVIDIATIESVVAMVPHQPVPGDIVECFFVVEKPGLDVARLGGITEDVPDK